LADGLAGSNPEKGYPFSRDYSSLKENIISCGEIPAVGAFNLFKINLQ
jgi:hypothetical protein